MLRKSFVDQVKVEIDRTLNAIVELESNTYDNGGYDYNFRRDEYHDGRRCATLRRASMDLSKSLSDLRIRGNKY